MTAVFVSTPCSPFTLYIDIYTWKSILPKFYKMQGLTCLTHIKHTYTMCLDEVVLVIHEFLQKMIIY